MRATHKKCNEELTTMVDNTYDSGILISSTDRDYCNRCMAFVGTHDIAYDNGRHEMYTRDEIDAMARSMEFMKGFRREVSGVKV